MILENILDKPKTNENQVFIIDQNSNKVIIKKNALRNLVYPVLGIIDKSGFSYDVLNLMTIIGSAITPISKNDTTCDIVVGINRFNVENEFRSIMRQREESTIIKAIQTDPKMFMKMKYNEKIDANDIIRLIGKIITETLNGRRIFSDGEMKVKYVVMSQEDAAKYIEGLNNFIIYENGKVVAKYIAKKNWGYLDFSKEVSPKQYFSDIVAELFKIFQMFKRVIADLANDGKISASNRDIYDYFKKIIEKIKNERFNPKYIHKWVTKTNRPIAYDQYGKPIDKDKTYNYMNVIYSHINPELIREETKNPVFDALFEMADSDEDIETTKEFAKEVAKEFGSFKPGSFLDQRVDMK